MQLLYKQQVHPREEAGTCSEGNSTGKAATTKPTLTPFSSSCFPVCCLILDTARGNFCLPRKNQKNQHQRGAALPFQQYFLTAGGMYPFFSCNKFSVLGKTVLQDFPSPPPHQEISLTEFISRSRNPVIPAVSPKLS